MVSRTGLKAVGATSVVVAAVGGAMIARADDPSAQSAQVPGGLSLSTVNAPSGTTLVLDQPAQAGAARTYKVANNSPTELAVTAKARPWRQSADGDVAANRRSTLAGVGVSEPQFTLAPGTSKDVTVTLQDIPSSGYLYGAFEVVGVPSDLVKRHNVVTGYRLLSTLRFNAAEPRTSIKPGTIKVTGKGAKRTITLSVRNTGNTIVPLTGSVRLKSPIGTRNASLKAARLLPGKTVKLTLASGRSLRAGSYTATVTLVQNKQKTKVTKSLRLR